MNINLNTRFISILRIVLIIQLMHGCTNTNTSNQSFDPNKYYADSLLASYMNAANIEDRKIADYVEDTIEIPTYDRVKRLFEQNCVLCHHPTGNAPFSLISYSDIRKRSLVIREVLDKHIMPPWSPDQSTETFFNAPELDQHSRLQIIKWLENGCPIDTGLVEENQFYFRKDLPDTILKNMTEFTIPTNDDNYQCFVIKNNDDSDLQIAGFEFRSENPQAVHHVGVFLTTDYEPTLDCWDCLKDRMDGVVQIGVWSRGKQPYVLDNGLYYNIPAQKSIILQVHYSPENKGKKDNVSIGLHYAKSIEREAHFITLTDEKLMVPKNEIVLKTLAYEVDSAINLLGIFPHMHFISRKADCFALTKDGKRIDLISFSEWDYFFQGQFMYNNPKYIPEGSTIYLNVVYDNTIDNPFQPNDPVRDVGFEHSGEGEMLVLCLMFENGDKQYINSNTGKLIR